MELVLLTGFKRSGKDTVANILKEKGYVRYALADIIKKHIYELFNLYIEDDNKEIPLKGNYSARDLYKAYGKGMLEYDPLVFCKYLHRNFKHDKIVISDVRYKKEFEYFLSLPEYNTSVIYIKRPLNLLAVELFGYNKITKFTVPKDLRHPSEEFLFNFYTGEKLPFKYLTIHNTSTIKHLRRQINGINYL